MHVSFRERLQGLILGSFLADAFSLGPHWIYDVDEIEDRFGKLNQIVSPESNRYHNKKEKGDFSHYGDQSFALLQSIQESNAFDIHKYALKWQDIWHEDYPGYLDSATKETLKNFEKGEGPLTSGSYSMELAGAARIAPFFLLFDSLEKKFLLEAVKNFVNMTHANPVVVEAALYFTSFLSDLLDGIPYEQAFQKSFDFELWELPVESWHQEAENHMSQDTTEAIVSIGQSCHISKAFPASILLLLKHHDDYQEAIINNTMAGGDSAARGMIVGMIIGANKGINALPKEWLENMNDYEQIIEVINQFGPM